MKNQIFQLEFAHDVPTGNSYFYSGLTLPAEDYEIRDALQKAQLTSAHDDSYDICIAGSPCLPSLTDVRLDCPTIDELNFLAKRIQTMDNETRLTYGAVIQKVISEDEPVSMKDLINCTYGLDEVSVASNVTNDAQLGAFIIENKMHEDVNAVPEDSRHLLDCEKIGELYRKTFGTVYTAGLCVFAGDYEMPEIYDGKQLPEETPSQWFAFRLLVADTPDEDETESNAEWISLPMGKDEADRIAKLHGAKRIEDCMCYDFESSVPQITSEMFGSMGDFDQLNQLAAGMAEMSPADQVKFKAVLEAEKPADINSVLDIAGHLYQYEMDDSISYDSDYFRAYLIHHLDAQFDTKWLDSLAVRDEGAILLSRQGATITDYGVISARGRSLYELVSYYPKISELDTSRSIETDCGQTEDDMAESQGMGMMM